MAHLAMKQMRLVGRLNQLLFLTDLCLLNPWVQGNPQTHKAHHLWNSLGNQPIGAKKKNNKPAEFAQLNPHVGWARTSGPLLGHRLEPALAFRQGALLGGWLDFLCWWGRVCRAASMGTIPYWLVWDGEGCSAITLSIEANEQCSETDPALPSAQHPTEAVW